MGSRILSGSLLVAGSAIGAGMLGIPLVTSNAGFFPAALASIFVAIFMLITGWFFVEITCWHAPGANILSIATNDGTLMLQGLVSHFVQVMPDPIFIYIVFTVFFGGIVTIGMPWITRCNAIALGIMAFSYIGLMTLGLHKVNYE